MILFSQSQFWLKLFQISFQAIQFLLLQKIFELVVLTVKVYDGDKSRHKNTFTIYITTV